MTAKAEDRRIQRTRALLHTVNAFLGLLRWWMDQPAPCPAEEIDRQFRALTIPAIAAALEEPTAAVSLGRAPAPSGERRH
jgi:hypothetical protein